MSSQPTYSEEKSQFIFETYNTFLQSPMYVQLSVFFLNKIPECFLPIEKGVLIEGLKSYAYHLSFYQPNKKDTIELLVNSMIHTIEFNFVSDEEFLNYFFIKNIQNNNLEGLIVSLGYLKKYQDKFFKCIDEGDFLKESRVINAHNISK